MSKTKLPVNPVGQSFYYPSLDGLRFFAFLIVFLHHSLLNISSNNLFINFFLVIIQKNGWVGVDLFFVLSGFLITNLLLKEREKFGSFSLKNFWMRRALRIWPLYYLALMVGFFFIPFILHNLFGQDFSNLAYQLEINKSLPYYLLFLGNWVVSLNGYSNFTNISHLWTISLEEQFYFIWPIILLFVKNIKTTFITGFLVILLSIITRLYLSATGVSHPGIYTNTLARIDTLTSGAILAAILHYRPNLLIFINKFIGFKFRIFCMVILAIILYKVYLFDPNQILNVTLGYLVIGMFMVYFVYTTIKKDGIGGFLKFKPFTFLGKISYGLYVWHILAIDLVASLLPGNDKKILMVTLAFMLTVIFGLLSYYMYEIWFLKLKSKFTRITSRTI